MVKAYGLFQVVNDTWLFYVFLFQTKFKNDGFTILINKLET